jgi:hypothetical protein
MDSCSPQLRNKSLVNKLSAERNEASYTAPEFTMAD